MLTALAAVIVLRKNATVKSLDVMVPIMAVLLLSAHRGAFWWSTSASCPPCSGRIFAEAFGLRQIAAGGFGAVLMNGVKRGLFSNEAGSGSAPCAAAAAACDDPVKMGFVQALGVLIDTVVICSCTAFLMLLVPQDLTAGLAGHGPAADRHAVPSGRVRHWCSSPLHCALFSFSTFLGVLYYARAQRGLSVRRQLVEPDRVQADCSGHAASSAAWQAYTVVWDLGDVGIGLMTIFNMIALYPLSGEAMDALNDYEKRKKLQ